ncbi:conserved hypothetical protein [Ricinus communis]|uniref:Uncharacterized protein n=1 Tax=Ricinus communis TaxID=3988 RepID=B9TJ68_RICCO|nr:conserved hypothetical protein [Ricinus communis]
MAARVPAGCRRQDRRGDCIAPFADPADEPGVCRDQSGTDEVGDGPDRRERTGDAGAAGAAGGRPGVAPARGFVFDALQRPARGRHRDVDRPHRRAAVVGDRRCHRDVAQHRFILDHRIAAPRHLADAFHQLGGVGLGVGRHRFQLGQRQDFAHAAFRQARQDGDAGGGEQRRQASADHDVDVDQVLAGEARHEHDLMAVQLQQVGGLADVAADVQQVGRGLVDQLVGADVVVGELQHLAGQPVVAGVGHALQVAQFFQRMHHPLRGAAVQAGGARDVAQRHVAVGAVESVQHLEGLLRRADEQRGTARLAVAFGFGRGRGGGTFGHVGWSRAIVIRFL